VFLDAAAKSPSHCAHPLGGFQTRGGARLRQSVLATCLRCWGTQAACKRSTSGWCHQWFSSNG